MFAVSVMIVGLGFMGMNHLGNLKTLESEGLVQIVSVVDCDTRRLESIDVPGYAEIEEALAHTDPDIAVICTNTKTHLAVLKQLTEHSPQMAIFIEKPLAPSSAEAEEAIKMLEGRKVTCGYLFRESPAAQAAIDHVKQCQLTVERVRTVWQKNRMEKGPPRPSEGVHIDEATHPIDLIVNGILPQLGYPVGDITIESVSAKRESQVGIPIVDRKMQESLYANDPDKLDPVAEVEYCLRVGEIPIEGFSSFAKGPQIREITLECSQQVTLTMRFDHQGGDELEIATSGVKNILSFPAPNKLLAEWRTFLNPTDKNSWKISQLQDMLLDVQLTEALAP